MIILEEEAQLGGLFTIFKYESKKEDGAKKDDWNGEKWKHMSNEKKRNFREQNLKNSSPIQIDFWWNGVGGVGGERRGEVESLLERGGIKDLQEAERRDEGKMERWVIKDVEGRGETVEVAKIGKGRGKGTGESRGESRD